MQHRRNCQLGLDYQKILEDPILLHQLHQTPRRRLRLLLDWQNLQTSTFARHRLTLSLPGNLRPPEIQDFFHPAVDCLNRMPVMQEKRHDVEYYQQKTITQLFQLVPAVESR